LRILLFTRRARVALCAFESAALLLLLLRPLFRVRLKVIVWDVGVAEDWRLRNWILDRVVPRADALLPMGNNQARAIVARWHPRGLVEAMPMCIDCGFFHPTGDRADGPVLAVGDDVSRDYPTLLRAVAGLARPVLLRTRLVRPEDVTDPNIHVIANFLSPIGYRDLLAGAAIVVLPLHPARHAGGVTTLVQAMASGKAMIVSRTEGLEDYLRHEQTCLVVPPHDPAALRAAIDRLLGDDRLRIALGEAARADTVAHRSLEVEARILESVITRLGVKPPKGGDVPGATTP